MLSLRLRLILLILLVLLPAFGLVLYSAYQQQQFQVAEARDNTIVLAREVAAKHMQAIARARELLLTLARLPAVRERDGERCSALFAELLPSYPHYLNIVGTNPDGNLFCGALPMKRPINVSTELAFRRALEHRELGLGEFALSRIDGRPYIGEAYPVLDERGKVIAVVGALLSVDWLNRMTAQTALPAGATLTILDASGNVVVHAPEPEKWVGKQQRDTSEFRALVRGEPYIEATGADGVARIYGLAKVDMVPPPAAFYVSVGVSTEAAFGHIREALWRHLLLLAMVACLALAVAWYGVEISVMRPVNRMVAATRKLAAGDLGARATIRSSGQEMQQLAQSFNVMAETLQKDTDEKRAAAAALQTTSARLRQLLAANPTILYALRVEGNRLIPVWVSENMTRVYGYSTEECLKSDWWFQHLHAEDRDRILGNQARLFAERSLVQEYRFIDKAGDTHWVRDDMRLLCDAAGGAAEVVGSWNDITTTHQADERLHLHAAALNSTRDAVVITDLDARMLAVNPAFVEITGYDEAEVLGQNPRILRSGHQNDAFYQTLWASLLQSGQWQGEIWNRRKNGEIYPQWLTISAVRNRRGAATHYVAVMTDLTMLKRSEEQLNHLAHYDPLTDLPNRLLLRSLLQRALERAQRHGHQVGVLFLNLDQFKTVNDSLGHASGDELLLGVTGRLAEWLRGEYPLGRLGGDEFVVVLETLQESLDAETIAHDLLAILDAPFVLPDGYQAHASASIGISIFPQDGTTAHDLLHRADAAMHRAKEHGGNQLAFYTDELSMRALERLEMEVGLRRALADGEFVLHYQPKVNLASGRITGAEALLRWLRPGHGIVSPLQFISLAEKSGQIVAIGAWVINEACRQIRAWADTGLSEVKVAVNVSARQFRSAGLEAVVTAALERHGVTPQHLGLELTESMLMETPNQAIDLLARLKRIGVQLALDDFGTGYSSLAYLGRFPMDQLKIDRSFVVDIVTDTSAANIANSVIALAHRMQLKVVAEGVETEAQLDYLRKNNCDEIQGYYFSKPVSAEDFAGLLRHEKKLPVAAERAPVRTLLVVDGEASALTATLRTLCDEGYRVLAAGSAREGLELLASNAVQVIISNLRLPDMNGTEFLGRVKMLHPETVRIVISAYTRLESVIQAVNEGALYKFLTKPCADDQLREQIRDAFRYYEAIVKPVGLQVP